MPFELFAFSFLCCSFFIVIFLSESIAPNIESVAFDSFDKRTVFCCFRRRNRVFCSFPMPSSPLHDGESKLSSFDVFKLVFVVSFD